MTDFQLGRAINLIYALLDLDKKAR
jgi:hypothetical protein